MGSLHASGRGVLPSSRFPTLIAVLAVGLLCVIPTTPATQQQVSIWDWLAKNNFNLFYGQDHLSVDPKNGALTFALTRNYTKVKNTTRDAHGHIKGNLINAEALGAHIFTPWFARAATVCADIKTAGPAGGAVFAFYATSGEPQNRTLEKWDELDFEFIHEFPKSVWVNVFHDGKKVAENKYGYLKPLGYTASAKFHTYCFTWDIVGKERKGVWLKDGKKVYEYNLKGWTKPLQVRISYWGTDVPIWCGIQNFTELHSQVKNIIAKIKVQ